MALIMKGFVSGVAKTIHEKDGEINIAYQIAGEGPPLLLLHGFPQTKVIWHRVAPELSKKFTVIATDLRGYGDSSKPNSKPDHSNYSKRAMSSDQSQVMKQLGFNTYFVVGHDRGGRVAHRLAADHSSEVQKLMVLDIAPTLAMYEQTHMLFAKSYWHWFFLIQKHPIPETLISGNTEFLMKQFMGGRHAGLGIFDPACWDEYLTAMKNPDCLHAMCEDYRASASVDLEHDREDIQNQFKLQMPVKVLWGEYGQVNACFKPLEDWKKVARYVSGHTVKSGHYIPEEIPEVLIEEIENFFN
ncbi:MAG: alpha/beta hydrolase [Polynucleobacter sp.]|nr:alpha/beta hydrolase [Polynucleobacter sp.]MDZ4055472.1 alpha/beta hydrolase [Polynucleobacter sp.]